MILKRLVTTITLVLCENLDRGGGEDPVTSNDVDLLIECPWVSECQENFYPILTENLGSLTWMLFVMIDVRPLLWTVLLAVKMMSIASVVAFVTRLNVLRVSQLEGAPRQHQGVFRLYSISRPLSFSMASHNVTHFRLSLWNWMFGWLRWL